LILLGLWLCLGAAAAAPPVRVLSFNIRCASCEAVDDVNHWSRRKFRVADVLRRYGADLVGLQEAELLQVRDLVQLLPEFDWVGVGRDDGHEQGEINAVLVRRSAFAIVTQQTLWLSPTPAQVSRGWDAALNRTLTLLRLARRDSAKELFFLNTHWDHFSRQARLESAKLVVQTLQSLDPALPVVLTGDFNDRPGFAGYRTLAAQLLDAELASHTRNEGGDITFNGFGHDVEPGNKIDYIFVSPGVDVLAHRVLTDRPQGLYASDHYPVAAELQLP
jgi:endonuclease/exonuclease/phosphatase family metal-dependent hydrolase